VGFSLSPAVSGLGWLGGLAWLAFAALLLVGAWALRRVEPAGGRVVLRLPLEPRRAVYVLEVAGRHLVVGSSEGGIQLLAELDGEAVQRLSAARRPAGAQPWAALLERWTRA